MLYHFKDDTEHPVLLSEPNMAGFFTQMIRGGTAYICTRLAEASEDEKIIYLFGCKQQSVWVGHVTETQPYNGFRWMSQTELLLELKANPKKFFERLREEGREDVWCDG